MEQREKQNSVTKVVECYAPSTGQSYMGTYSGPGTPRAEDEERAELCANVVIAMCALVVSLIESRFDSGGVSFKATLCSSGKAGSIRSTSEGAAVKVRACNLLCLWPSLAAQDLLGKACDWAW